ncbi:hypothetical protein B5E53_07120 [Eubacterium sp. An11]|uniref:DUF2634 domain-containing protein n=1 Tax=Eubacterium sp. An11 TaxID=1965542 RepID=UPI000B372C33|nr:DUF2634 domain-containing protein [Eubacterium sp. An11]OUQ68232.1 hypothetical protein B5E53_07120 [Eubacterium sp. An11]
MDEDELFMDLEETEDEDGDSDEIEEEIIYRTYRMDFKNKRIIGMVDGIDAAVQAIFKALQTRRFAHIIYDDQYGCDIFNKIGNLSLTQSYLDTDIPAMIEDTFQNEDMIQGFSDMDYEIVDGDSVRIQLFASTIFGDVNLEGVINDG